MGGNSITVAEILHAVNEEAAREIAAANAENEDDRGGQDKNGEN